MVLLYVWVIWGVVYGCSLKKIGLRLPGSTGVVVGLFLRDKCRTCTINNYIHSSLLGEPFRSISVAASTRPTRVVSILRGGGVHCVGANLGRNAVATLIGGGPCRVATFHESKSCGSSHRPRDIRFIHDLRRSLHHHSFAIGTVTCGTRHNAISLFNNGSSLRGKVVHTIKGPSGEFGRSTLHVVHTVHFTSILNFRVRGRARSTLLGGT